MVTTLTEMYQIFLMELVQNTPSFSTYRTFFFFFNLEWISIIWVKDGDFLALNGNSIDMHLLFTQLWLIRKRVLLGAMWRQRKYGGRLGYCICNKLFDVLLVLKEKMSSNSHTATYPGLTLYICTCEDLHIRINHPRQLYHFYREKSNINNTANKILVLP